MTIWFSWFGGMRNNCSRRRMEVTQTVEQETAGKRVVPGLLERSSGRLHS
jgi:hypothetical protein